MVHIDEKEAQEILERIAPEGVGDPEQRLAALIGIIGVVRGMQEIGYRIARPLKSVPSSGT